MAALDWDKIIQAVDKINIAGDYPAAKVYLKPIIQKKRIPRRRAFELVVQLCLAGMAKEALVLIAPHVRKNLSTFETVEYARALIFSGTGTCAVRLLEEVREHLTPGGLYILSLGYLINWEFSKARPILETYIKYKGLSDRDRVIGKMNLGVTLRREGKDIALAEKILQETMTEGKRLGLDFVERDSRREWGYCPLLKGNPAESIKRFDEYDRIYPIPEPDKWALENAWRALALLDLNGDKEAMANMHKAKDEIERRGQYYMLRAISFQEGRIRKDKDLLLKVYFSSPFKSLKENIVSLVGKNNIPETFDLFVGPLSKSNKKRITIHLLDGEYGNPESEKLKPGSVVQRMFHTLGSDPYFRYRLMNFVDAIFPGERIDPLSAKRRIEQGLHRLRSWLTLEKLPLEIHMEAGLIWMEAISPCTLRISGLEKLSSHAGLNHFLQELKDLFKDQEFNSSEVVQGLDISSRTAQRQLVSAVTDGVLLRIGSGPKTRYRFNQ